MASSSGRRSALGRSAPVTAVDELLDALRNRVRFVFSIVSGTAQREGDEPPHDWDFLYFSFVIAMTSQVSDVLVRSRHIRRSALIQGVLAFFFNAGTLAFTINIVASLK